jgi:hypothetical protein
VKKALFGFMLAALLPATAFATSWKQTDTFFIKLNFGNKYFGKEVTGVYAHVGIQKIHNTCGFRGVDYWDKVQHVQMTKKGDHFFKAIIINDAMSECAPTIKGPVVQYWVYVQGQKKEMLTQTVAIPTNHIRANMGSGPDKTADMTKAFKKEAKDATRTEATRYSFAWAS